MAIKSLARSSILQPQETRFALAGYQTNMFHHLETVRLSSSAASVEFTNLGEYSDYQHLQIRMTNRTDAVDVGDWLRIQFNGDSTGANYDSHTLWGDGSSVSSARYAGNTGGADGGILYAASLSVNATANAFSAMVMDILDPFETTKYTTIRALYGQHGGYNRIALGSSLWMNTAALTSLTLLPDTSSNFISGSRFSLYGLKVRA